MQMAGELREYLWAMAQEAPVTWRRGAVIVTIVANVLAFGALLIGWHLNAITNLQLWT